MKLLPAIVLEASKQSYKVKRLVDYCRELDGTEIRVIQLPPEIDSVPHPIGTEMAIRYAGAMLDEPWLYMEADSIPLNPGWLAKITEEYHREEKLFMLPSLEGCPEHDIASAIGVWPAHLHKHLPKDCTKLPYFDFFIYKNRKEDTHFTKQIQHRYGHYAGHNIARRYEFPRDLKCLTKEAVIFHADPTQSIIRGGLLQSYYHSGDFGDIIAALPIIRQQGGGRLILGPPHIHKDGKNPRMVMNSYRSGSLIPLLEIQPYIKRVEYKKWHDADPDFDLSTFRFMDRKLEENLGEWQGRYIGREQLDMSKWLEVDAPWTGRIAVSRSSSYHNHLFPWKQIAEIFRDRIIFVGFPHEHFAWQKLTGVNVELAQTSNLLDMTNVLAGCEFHFGNQSLPAWITMGLGKTIIMEVWPNEPNSIVKNCPKSIFASTRQDMKELCTQYLSPKDYPNQSQ